MEESTIDFEQIEQELQELRSRFSRADQVLRDLEEIQSQFESIAKTHNKLKEYVAEVSRFNSESGNTLKDIKRVQKNFEQRFTELREENELKLDDLKSQLLQAENRLSSHDNDIQELQPSISLVKKNCNDINDIKKEFGGLPKQIQNLVDQQLSSTQKNYRDLKKQIITMRYALIFSVILFLLLVTWVGLQGKSI
ncbi:MAG: hypothetical protein RH949_32165 [Coleofasciculus sp. A1-SPW-01]|uniref:hypothetical protein n=1 Tax=Coleofasciculus sp. A1-SPW-01 TaxID=3070819 RepID=UPI0032F23BF7